MKARSRTDEGEHETDANAPCAPSGKLATRGPWKGDETCQRCGGPYWLGCRCTDPPDEDAEWDGAQ